MAGDWSDREFERYEKSYAISTDDTSAEIAEAFGIEGGYEKEILDLRIPKPLPDVTYITGESGCGKSTLIRQMADADSVAWEDLGSESLPDTPLWSWAEDTDTAIELLSKVGLGDATLFVSSYDGLSDSQQYRARLYKGLLSDREVLYLDEFLSTLDRRTAKAVAFVFQKAIRRSDKKAVVATAHDDLSEYLRPGLTIRGRAFPSRWTVTEGSVGAENPFIEQLEFERKDSSWYQQCDLAELHYKGKHTGGIKDYIGGYLDDRLVSLLIGTYRMHDGGRRISRIVTHPSYRSIGIGQETISYYLDEHPDADVVAEMAKYNPVFKKAGMERVEDSTNEPPADLKNELDEHGFDRGQWYKQSYCKEFMAEKEHREMFSEFAHNIGNKRISPGGQRLDDSEIGRIIKEHPDTAGRLLWSLRPKQMAKFVGPKYGEIDHEKDETQTNSASEVEW
jgi:ABC-type lipoprotein export system ATPase subunit